MLSCRGKPTVVVVPKGLVVGITHPLGRTCIYIYIYVGATIKRIGPQDAPRNTDAKGEDLAIKGCKVPVSKTSIQQGKKTSLVIHSLRQSAKLRGGCVGTSHSDFTLGRERATLGNLAT